jgi:hypothetical protein
MKFSAMLAAHDDAALEALVSKGLVRRARRDLEAGLATISARGDGDATVLADGQTVEIDARGPSAARCTCPAGGVCRHILLAIMALRTGTEGAAPAVSDAPPSDAQKGASAIEEICAPTQAELMKFARADWDAAAALAAASEGVSIVTSGRNCTIELAGAPVAVTFIAGQGLKNAVYKGPKSRMRVIVTACAILLRTKHGVAVEAIVGEDTSAPEAPLAAEFLGNAGDTLARATRIVLAGSSPIAVDMLFELAISARAEAAPRLTAQLRRLARMAGLAITRDVRFEPDIFLAEAARTCALIEALKRDSTKPALTGSLRRDYRPHPALDLWMLGASSWRSETGARGLTLYGFAPETKRWHSASFARAAGQDPSFDPKAQYRLPVWSARTVEKLMGQAVHLPEPLIAADNTITTSLPTPAKVKAPVKGAEALIEAGASHVRWEDLRRDLSARIGGGLERRSQPAPALIAPAKFGGFAFDEFAQTYEWEAIDQAGDTILLTLPASADALAVRLKRESRRIRSVLIEATVGQDRPILRPIAILSDENDGLSVLNLDLDHWQAPKMIHAVVDAAQEALTSPLAPAAPPSDPLSTLAARAIDVAAAIAAGTKAADLDEVTRSCEAAGLLTLANQLERMSEQPDIRQALGTAYIAGEIHAALMWS